MISDKDLDGLGCGPGEVLEMARCRLGGSIEKPNLFLVPQGLTRLPSDHLCSIVCECLRPEFPTYVFDAALPTADSPAGKRPYVCIAVDSSRPERVKDIIKERLWATRDNRHAPATMEDILHGRYEKKAAEFRLEDYGVFVPFRTSQPADVRTHSFHHRPTFYRYRVALTRVSRIPEPLREYLHSLFTSCPNHLFNRGTFRASGVREGLLNLMIPLKEIRHHEIVALAGQSQGFEKVKSRHENVQKFLLERDPNTIACELPVWIESWEFEEYCHVLKTRETLTGHIDVLRQECDGVIGIWDYKPNAAGETRAGVQVFLYALMLSLRTGLPMTGLRCGYFDETSAYMFRPSEVGLPHES
jgi:hypothetical protein